MLLPASFRLLLFVCFVSFLLTIHLAFWILMPNNAERSKSTDGKPSNSANLLSLISARDAAKQFLGKVHRLADSIPDMLLVELPTLSAAVSPQHLHDRAPSTMLPGCDRPQSGHLCVPLSVSELNSTCPGQFDLGPGLRCGAWRPANCSTPVACVAVIVPYRNRQENLLLLVQQLHSLLQRQSVQYSLYVVEQADERPFNRAKLLNIGYSLARRYQPCDCFVFHDADKLPKDLKHVYECDRHRPRHMIGWLYNPASHKYKRGELYHDFFGGVTALTSRQFESVNGYSNLYYGWGREDDDLSIRLRVQKWSIWYSEGSRDTAAYVNLDHKSDLVVNSMPLPNLISVQNLMAVDGLSSLMYNLTGTYCHKLFTLFQVAL